MTSNRSRRSEVNEIVHCERSLSQHIDYVNSMQIWNILHDRDVSEIPSKVQPFYSGANMNVLRQSIADADQWKLVSHELLD
jgi:hypothetical protein